MCISSFRQEKIKDKIFSNNKGKLVVDFKRTNGIVYPVDIISQLLKEANFLELLDGIIKYFQDLKFLEVTSTLHDGFNSATKR